MAGYDGDKESFSGAVQMRSWLDRYVGLPFVDQGRSIAGCDCWGLVRLVYANELKIDLPTYGEISAHDLVAVSQMIEGNYVLEPWREINRDSIMPFDVVVMRFYGTRKVGHVGVVAAGGTMVLHTERSVDSVVVPLQHMTIRSRIVGFRRHKEVSGG